MTFFAARAIILGATLLSLTYTPAFAAGNTSAPEKPEGPVEFEYRGDADKGEQLSATCTACHGVAGNSAIAAFPKLAGQGARYTYKQLQDMKKIDGQEPLRNVVEMSAIVASLSDQDMADLAAYFEQQTGSVIGADPALVELGETIYRTGNKKTNVPACTSCHLPDGLGVTAAGYPMLAGQHPDYTTKQLKAFRAAGREDLDAEYRINDGETMQMRLTAKGMSDKEIRAVSAYVAGLMTQAQKKATIKAE